MSKLSLYADSLPPDAKTRYVDKIESIGGLDPFSSDFVGEKSDVVPPSEKILGTILAKIMPKVKMARFWRPISWHLDPRS